MGAVETMVEEGTVRAVRGTEIEVVVERQAACSSCAARGACLTFAPGRRVVRVQRGEGDPEAGPGDRVTLEIRSLTFLRASLLGYLVPTLAFFAGVGAVFLIVDPRAGLLGLGRDLAAFVAGLAGVVVAFAALGIAGTRPSARRRYSPRIVAVHRAVDPAP